MKQEVSPKILYGVLSVIALTVLIFVGRWALTPAPAIPNPATVQEPTG